MATLAITGTTTTKSLLQAAIIHHLRQDGAFVHVVTGVDVVVVVAVALVLCSHTATETR